MKNKKGFTVVELIITLALLVIVLAIGYQLINYAHSNYDRTSNYWERQNKVISLSTYIESAIDNANYLMILTELTDDYSGVDELETIIYTKEGDYKIMTDDTIDEDDRVLTDFREEEFVNIDVVFNRVKQRDGETYFPNLLEIVVSAEDINFSLATKVKIENINGDTEILGESSGSIIIFRNP